jgi:hypothetical protein
MLLANVFATIWAYIAGLGPVGGGMVAAGAVLVVLAVLMLASVKRWARLSDDERTSADAARGWMERLLTRLNWSVPTASLAGLSVLAIGYHLVAWGLPNHATPLKVPAQWWFALPLAAGVLIAVSRAIDRAEAEREDAGRG